MTHIERATDGAVGTIRIDRAEKKNAFSERMWSDLTMSARELAEDGTLRAVVVCSGNDAFSAGADIGELPEILASKERFAQNQRLIDKALDAVSAIPVPTIAAIRGACVGGGLSLALACDLRIADQTAIFGLTPARLGLVYGARDTIRLRNVVGDAITRRLLLTAEIIDAERAWSVGLVGDLGADLDEVLDGVLARIAPLSGYSTRATKRILAALDGDPVAASALADELRIHALDENDLHERLRPFRRRNTGDEP